MSGRGDRVSLVKGRSPVNAHGLAEDVNVNVRKVYVRECAHLARIPFAAIERVVAVVTRHIPITAHNVVNVLAESGSIGTISACSYTEFIECHKILEKMESVSPTSYRHGIRIVAYGPFMHLLQGTKRRGENKATDRVPFSVRQLSVGLKSNVRIIPFPSAP